MPPSHSDRLGLTCNQDAFLRTRRFESYRRLHFLSGIWGAGYPATFGMWRTHRFESCIPDHAIVVQLVEYFLGKEEIVGSNPTFCSIMGNGTACEWSFRLHRKHQMGSNPIFSTFSKYSSISFLSTFKFLYIQIKILYVYKM